MHGFVFLFFVSIILVNSNFYDVVHKTFLERFIGDCTQKSLKEETK
jgi:hypothetical protein